MAPANGLGNSCNNSWVTILEVSHYIRSFAKALARHLGNFIQNRELKFVASILLIYTILIATLYVLLWLQKLQLEHFVSATVTASCITFLLAQIAFLSRAKALERVMQFKGLLITLFEETKSEDDRVIGYMDVGSQTIKIMQQSKSMQESKEDTEKQASQAFLHFSLVAIKNCQSELRNILAERQIRRSGNLAFQLTKECYTFAKKEIYAVAHVSEKSLDFWEDVEGIGRYFYSCNEDALAEGVRVHRYFLFTRADIDRITIDFNYRKKALSALSTYIQKLPKSDLYLAFRRTDWQRLFPINNAPDDMVMANRKFRDQYPDSFPDVSLFDKSVASLWQGASSEKVDEVCIAWATMDIKSVKHLFKGAFIDVQRHSVVHKRQENETSAQLLESFLSKVQALESA